MEEREKKGVEMLPSLHKKLKTRAATTGRPLWALLEEAIERYLGEVAETEPDDPLIVMMREVLSYADAADVGYLKSILAGRLEHLRKQGKPVRTGKRRA